MVLICSSDMVWCQKGVLRVLFDDADFWPKMRMKINLGAKTNMGSTSTPWPNQRHQQVPRAYRRSTISFFSGQQALCRLAVRNFCFKCIELWHALAWALARYGTLWHLLCELCGLWPRVTMGSYGHVKYLYTFWKPIQPFENRARACQSVTFRGLRSRVIA